MQAEEGYVSGDGIKFCADKLDLTTAEVSGVATFYSMYKRRAVGDYHVGVCTNTLCAVLGGDEIFAALKQHLGVENDQHRSDAEGRSLTLEHIECNAACDFAPVMTVNWEFFDNMTPEKAKAAGRRPARGRPVIASRGPAVCSFRETERIPSRGGWSRTGARTRSRRRLGGSAASPLAGPRVAAGEGEYGVTLKLAPVCPAPGTSRTLDDRRLPSGGTATRPCARP